MSPRPKKNRFIEQPPVATGFIPAGGEFVESQSIVLNMEEFESIRLSDYLNLTQLESSRMLNVSRPTFTRIYHSARKKVAQAFVENRGLLISGGQVVFHDEWFACSDCESVFKGVSANKNENPSCPVCNSNTVGVFNETPGDTFGKFRGTGKGFGYGMGQSGNCICPRCDRIEPHVAGVPCSSQLCVDCNIRMVRQDSDHHIEVLKKRKQ